MDSPPGHPTSDSSNDRPGGDRRAVGRSTWFVYPERYSTKMFAALRPLEELPPCPEMPGGQTPHRKLKEAGRDGLDQPEQVANWLLPRSIFRALKSGLPLTALPPAAFVGRGLQWRPA